MKKNLIVEISRGLGNQMFLYASSYAFARKLNYNLLIDDEMGVSHDKKKWKKKRVLNWIPKYELGIFNLKSNIADDKYKLVYAKRKYLKFLDKFQTQKNFLIEKIYNNKKTLYSDDYLSKKYADTIYLEGNFESENYFKDYRTDLLNEFNFKLNHNLNNNAFKKMIDNSNVVSIAVRRNRFSESVEDQENQERLQMTANFESDSIKYIYRGVEYFKSKIKDPKFLIWSDDFENLEKHFDQKKFTFVKSEPKNKIFTDFFLMRQCKYFIVGSTCFHWWPAWLCNYEEKIIVCPKDLELNVSYNVDFWPESWIKI